VIRLKGLMIFEMKVYSYRFRDALVLAKSQVIGIYNLSTIEYILLVYMVDILLGYNGSH